MASRALISYTNSSGQSTSLTVEQSASNGVPVYTEDTLVAWASSFVPVGMELTSVRFSEDFAELIS